MIDASELTKIVPIKPFDRRPDDKKVVLVAPCARAKVLEAVEIVPASMRDPEIVRIGLRCLAEFPRLAVVLQRSTVKFGLRINLFLQGDLAVNPTPGANCHTAMSHGTNGR